jgi:hypothetical protein
MPRPPHFEGWPFERSFGTPVCAAPQECRNCYASDILVGWPAERLPWQPCLRSLSRVPKLLRLGNFGGVARKTVDSSTPSAQPLSSARRATYAGHFPKVCEAWQLRHS